MIPGQNLPGCLVADGLGLGLLLVPVLNLPPQSLTGVPGVLKYPLPPLPVF